MVCVCPQASSEQNLDGCFALPLCRRGDHVSAFETVSARRNTSTTVPPNGARFAEQPDGSSGRGWLGPSDQRERDRICEFDAAVTLPIALRP
ncbi:unnamed protein product [Mycena citricolor]|uniref:Uncharacterized protein n=1 Tax=Mycena citricolor TaxID=2018698 RepID=A0AAD2HV24_9AGAR|nr:unnamed protein product [Mycena citricolor]